MPNHVINILSFEGDKAKIRQMLEDIKDDEYGIHSVDFNKRMCPFRISPGKQGNDTV